MTSRLEGKEYRAKARTLITAFDGQTAIAVLPGTLCTVRSINTPAGPMKGELGPRTAIVYWDAALLNEEDGSPSPSVFADTWEQDDVPLSALEFVEVRKGESES